MCSSSKVTCNLKKNFQNKGNSFYKKMGLSKISVFIALSDIKRRYAKYAT